VKEGIERDSDLLHRGTTPAATKRTSGLVAMCPAAAGVVSGMNVCNLSIALTPF
jgi:hypothetical protein